MRKVEKNRGLAALLSQVLVAYTVEFDNEFERRMGAAGYGGAGLSLSVWSNVMRFVPEGGVSVRNLGVLALAGDTQMKFGIGCLERWRFVVLQPEEGDTRDVPVAMHRQAGRELRDGWGSGRGIRGQWIVRATTKGRKAIEIWPELFGEMEKRWKARFGEDVVERLRNSLRGIVNQLDVELPEPVAMDREEAEEAPFPPRKAQDRAEQSLPALLSQVLMAFALEFDRESRVSLALCANMLRVLGKKPVPVREIPRLTGGSRETTAMGWQMKRFVQVENDRAGKRGKAVRLNALGLEAQRTYRRLIGEIEKRWEARFGKKQVDELRASLLAIFAKRNGNASALATGLVAPEGVARAGAQKPALGRREMGAAARQRVRDLVEQTEAFVRDPEGALPFYPLWDMNRGFGP